MNTLLYNIGIKIVKNIELLVILRKFFSFSKIQFKLASTSHFNELRQSIYFNYYYYYKKNFLSFCIDF
jgi:hypothetical protein